MVLHSVPDCYIWMSHIVTCSSFGTMSSSGTTEIMRFPSWDSPLRKAVKVGTIKGEVARMIRHTTPQPMDCSFMNLLLFQGSYISEGIHGNNRKGHFSTFDCSWLVCLLLQGLVANLERCGGRFLTMFTHNGMSWLEIGDGQKPTSPCPHLCLIY